MTYFSSFWYKHYKELRNCCMTEPLITHPFVNERDKKVPPDLDGKLIRDLIDVGWMSEKGLKWFGWDVNGWFAWTDANGMIYRIRDLKRNEDGKRFEKEVKKIIRVDEPRNDIHANAKDLYQHEFNLFRRCWSYFLTDSLEQGTHTRNSAPRCSSCSEGSTGTTNKNRSPERLHYQAA